MAHVNRRLKPPFKAWHGARFDCCGRGLEIIPSSVALFVPFVGASVLVFEMGGSALDTTTSRGHAYIRFLVRLTQKFVRLDYIL